MRRNRILIGDAVTRLGELPAHSVDTVVTSPPYFQLRDYATPGQIGLEPTPQAWVAKLRAVGAEIARVLAPHGSWWLNLGDSYSRGDGGVAAKSLVLAPERLLLALAEDGWLVRNKIVWHKPNPVPTSATDRLNTSWEPLYLLVRSPRYYFDLDAIRSPHQTTGSPSGSPPRRDRHRPQWAGPLAGDQHGLARLRAQGLPGHPLGKNPGDVWRFPTAPRRGRRLAVFPDGLVERAVRAGCPEAVCTGCQRPWQRPVRRPAAGSAQRNHLQPDCACGAPARASLVLDPFLGSGTTARVAQRLGRDWLGIELHPATARAARQRLNADASAAGRAA